MTLCVSQAPYITFIHNFNHLDQILWLIAMHSPEDDYKAFVSSLDTQIIWSYLVPTRDLTLHYLCPQFHLS